MEEPERPLQDHPAPASDEPGSDVARVQLTPLSPAQLALPFALLTATALAAALLLLLLVLRWRNARIRNKGSHDHEQRSIEQPLHTLAQYSPTRTLTRPVRVVYIREMQRTPQRSDDTHTGTKPEDQDVGPSDSTAKAEDLKKLPKLPLPEQWLIKKPFECYAGAIPRPLNAELKAESCIQIPRASKNSVTRSPSLEKDDKSPFVQSAKSDKVEVFRFNADILKRTSDNTSPVVEVCVDSSPKELTGANDIVHPVEIYQSISISNEAQNEIHNRGLQNESSCNLKRYRSVSTKLNICSVSDSPHLEGHSERLEMQNSPRMLECSSTIEKSTTRFDFSPKLLAETFNSPRFFTPPDNVSPIFFTEPSPKSVYYDSVRSPKFFPDTPQCQDEEKFAQSPKALGEHQNRNAYGCNEKSLSPRLLTSNKPRSPKVHSCNKENYFSFENNNLVSSTIEDRNGARPSPLAYWYSGRNSIEKERLTSPTEKADVKKYRRHNSCDTNHKLNLSNAEFLESLKGPFDEHLNGTNLIDKCVTNMPPKANEPAVQDNDVVDSCAKSLPIEIDDKNTNFCKDVGEKPRNLNTAHERRQRLKSISLDSDNAKIIEQNLGLPIAKQMKDQINNAYKQHDITMSWQDVEQKESLNKSPKTVFKFDPNQISNDAIESIEPKTSDLKLKKLLRQGCDVQAFLDMPRFSPKEFEITVTSEEGNTTTASSQTKRKTSKNLRNLTIDLSKRDSDLEKELLEFEKLYIDSEEKKVKTPTLKVKATSLDSSDSVNLSLPQKTMLEVPQNSVSVPNTPKRQLKRILAQKTMLKCHEQHSGAKLGYNSLQCTVDQRRMHLKSQGSFLDSGIFLRENHANLMLYQPGCSRTMGSFDENISEYAENAPEISVSGADNKYLCAHQLDIGSSTLGSNLLNYKQSLSVSNSNLKTLPEGVPSNDFEPSVEDDKIMKKLYRRGSNQSLMLGLDVGKHSSLSVLGSNCSLGNVGIASHNLTTLRNSPSNYSLNIDNRQKLILERQNSNSSVTNTDHLAPTAKLICLSNANLQTSTTNLCEGQNPPRSCLLQRRGSNNSLTLNIQGSSTTSLSRVSSNSSLTSARTQRKGLLERRSSNTSLTLNISGSDPPLTSNRGLSVSNYNLDASACSLSRCGSNLSICTQPSIEPKRGILERRNSNTSLTLNIQSQEPRDLEIDENVLESNLNEQHKEQNRKSLSTENLIPKSYKNRIVKSSENKYVGFGSHDNLWSASYVAENNCFRENCPQNITFICGDQENEIIYAFGSHEAAYSEQGFTRNITTKPLSPQTTSEEFKIYLANIQHLQNASNVLSRQQLRDLDNVFQNGYSNVKCGNGEVQHCCSGTVEDQLGEPCSDYQKRLLRNLHQEFWDMPTNYQEKPLVFGSHGKNRYRSILPNEHSRVILRAELPATEDGYINANYIKGHEFSKNNFIATQGPLQHTIYDFWLMVQQNYNDFRKNSDSASKSSRSIQKIVMLTNFVESNRQKCEKYFPLEINEELVFHDPEFTDFFTEVDMKSRNSFTIRNSGIINKAGYTIRKLNVRYNKGKKVTDNSDKISDVHRNCETDGVHLNTRSLESARSDVTGDVKVTKTESVLSELEDDTSIVVYHYWFHNWADHKCPKDVNALLNLSLDVLRDCVYDFNSVDLDSKLSESLCPCNDSPTDAKFVFPSTEAPYSSSACKSDAEVPQSPIALDPCEESSGPSTIVHCSAGVGRTGCLLALLMTLRQLSVEQRVDVLGAVCALRLARGGLVQSSEQYELIHKVLCLYERVCLPSQENRPAD